MVKMRGREKVAVGSDVVRVTTQKKNVVPDTSETEEKHTLPSNFPAGFFPPLLSLGLGARLLFVFIFIFRCYGLLREKAVPFPSKRN